MKIFILLILYLSLNSDELIKPIPQQIDVNYNKVELGRKLFFDKRLSRKDTISCYSCHDLSHGGTNTIKPSIGANTKTVNTNIPTVFNSVYNTAQFWDGRAKTLKEQVRVSLLVHEKIAGDENAIIMKLSEDSYYETKFEGLYPEGITLDTISDAIAEFEKTLITPNSKFDLYLKGEISSLTQAEKDGYTLFKNLGCISCHNGINIGSNMFQKFGIFNKPKISFNNLGRFNVTKNENDKYYFKVPTLRNIEKTAPYFHDGSARTLKKAVKIMGYYQLGQNLTQNEIQKIISFLRTLTGELPKYK